MTARKKKPKTSAALDRIAAALKRLSIARIGEYVRELHRRNAERGARA
jgi:hypothetical protein